MASRYALLLANAEYRHDEIQSLLKTGADAEGMRQVLMDCCYSGAFAHGARCVILQAIGAMAAHVFKRRLC